MVTSTKTHFRSYNKVILHSWNGFMKIGPDRTEIIHNNRFKIFLTEVRPFVVMHGFVYGPLFDAYGTVTTAQLGFLFSRGVPVCNLAPRLCGIGRRAIFTAPGIVG